MPASDASAEFTFPVPNCDGNPGPDIRTVCNGNRLFLVGYARTGSVRACGFVYARAADKGDALRIAGEVIRGKSPRGLVHHAPPDSEAAILEMETEVSDERAWERFALNL